MPARLVWPSRPEVGARGGAAGRRLKGQEGRERDRGGEGEREREGEREKEARYGWGEEEMKAMSVTVMVRGGMRVNYVSLSRHPPELLDIAAQYLDAKYKEAIAQAQKEPFTPKISK